MARHNGAPAALQPLRSTICDAPWISALGHEVATCDRSTWESGTIQVIQHGPKQLLAAHGRIAEHIDDDFPPWSYLLILAAPSAATLHVRQHAPVVLTPGMLIEFNSHVRHRLVQRPREDAIWCPIDSKDRLNLDEAFARIAEIYA
ncbi:hypothetical protein [Sphingomonas sp. 3-13AW]|uniref:hypothetical protein n=1 Tax=Sphingomonas sp. 3-13AW TaxID=3050450 RepID=UPI003BB5FB05